MGSKNWRRRQTFASSEIRRRKLLTSCQKSRSSWCKSIRWCYFFDPVVFAPHFKIPSEIKLWRCRPILLAVRAVKSINKWVFSFGASHTSLKSLIRPVRPRDTFVCWKNCKHQVRHIEEGVNGVMKSWLHLPKFWLTQETTLQKTLFRRLLGNLKMQKFLKL